MGKIYGNSSRKHSRYRILDLDDLIILKMLGEGCSCKDIRIAMGVTAPAISHRLKKYRGLWDGFHTANRINPSGNRTVSEEALKAADMATKVLEALCG